jgi:sodium-dependent dicarboxylate transporter 2/3/5
VTAHDPRASRRRTISLSIAAVLLLLGVAGVPQRLGLAAPASACLTILVVAAALWVTEAVPLFVTSLVILLLEVVWLPKVVGAAAPPARFLAPFFSDVVLLFLGGFVLSAALEAYRLDERLAHRVLQRTGTAPGAVLGGMMGATAFLSMWMSNTAATAMMLALALTMLEQVPEEDPFRRALLLGIPFAANLGGLGTPIGTPPNAIAIRYLASVGSPVSFARWMLVSVPLMVVLLALAWWLLLKFFPPKLAAVPLAEEPPAEAASGRAKTVLAICVLTVLGWLTSDLHGFSAGTVALLPLIVLFGFGFLGIPNLRALPWDVLLVVGGGLSLGVAVEVSGLGNVLVAQLPTEGASALVVWAAFAVVGGAMTAVMSNTATANLLLPLVASLKGLSPAPLVFIVAYACSVSMPLPVSTPPNAMVFGSGMIRVNDMVKPGLVISILGLLLVVAFSAGLLPLAGIR